MSDLVERVARRLCKGDPDRTNCGALTSSSHYKAWEWEKEDDRAAIAEVAKWMIDNFSYQAEMIEIRNALEKELERQG